ncbi:hypothetical protein RUM44_004720 [Polyplax serrata]|uniref:Serine/threonine-protein kinase RIO1 n=1 Tax=Polyplax serrata TaxID=468196 RepID=A0ABR1B3P7_POLSC
MDTIVEGQFSDAEDEPYNNKLNGKHYKGDQGISQITTKLEKETFSDGSYDDDSDEFQWSDNNNEKGDIKSTKGRMNPQGQSSKVMNYQSVDKLFSKFSGKISVDKYECPGGGADRARIKDKADRATSEQVMDPRTRMILFKLLNRGTIQQIDGCISTGKEANVYHALGRDGNEHIAIKIYKTSILIFKDRDRYVTGEYRFRHGYCRHNPRKMVKTWAEKEMRNLVRLHSAGLPVPEPKLLKSHVLLMAFLGKDGWPARKLKDVDLSTSKACQLYRDCVMMIWKMYNVCKLIHADLSEFNMLYHESQLYLIDVSQSVEKNHPHALEFLRSDCTNITEFFKKKDVATLTVKKLFNFITDMSITEQNVEEYLDKLQQEAVENQATAEELTNDEVFKKTYIPQNLYEVIDFEKDIELVKAGQKDEAYKKMLGLECEKLEESSTDKESNTNSTDEESEGEEEQKSKFVNSRRPKDETPESRNLRKKAVKEQQAEKRKTKIKKHIKKRKEKISKK